MEDTFYCDWCRTRHPIDALAPALRLKKSGHKHCVHGAKKIGELVAKRKRPRRGKQNYEAFIKHIERKQQ